MPNPPASASVHFLLSQLRFPPGFSKVGAFLLQKFQKKSLPQPCDAGAILGVTQYRSLHHFPSPQTSGIPMSPEKSKVLGHLKKPGDLP